VTLHIIHIFVEMTMVSHSFLIFLFVCFFLISTLGFYVTFKVVKLMFIAFFYSIGVNDTVKLLYITINLFMEELLCDEL